MTDIHEVPAVPETDTGGDDRLGMFVAGGVLIALGWGLAVIANLLLHSLSPIGGLDLGPARISTHLGTFAWATVALGLITGAVGVGLLLVARQSPRGPLVLPGYPY